MLDTYQQILFDALEQRYLYDIPEESYSLNEQVECLACHRMVSKLDVNMVNGDAYCTHCVEQMIRDGELDEEDIE